MTPARTDELARVERGLAARADQVRAGRAALRRAGRAAGVDEPRSLWVASDAGGRFRPVVAVRESLPERQREVVVDLSQAGPAHELEAEVRPLLAGAIQRRGHTAFLTRNAAARRARLHHRVADAHADHLGRRGIHPAGHDEVDDAHLVRPGTGSRLPRRLVGAGADLFVCSVPASQSSTLPVMSPLIPMPSSPARSKPLPGAKNQAHLPWSPRESTRYESSLADSGCSATNSPRVSCSPVRLSPTPELSSLTR